MSLFTHFGTLLLSTVVTIKMIELTFISVHKYNTCAAYRMTQQITLVIDNKLKQFMSWLDLEHCNY